MTKAKNTKKALLLSVLSMMLCLSMLVGSTFAWFTDSVTSGVNKIVAGNLDVELEYATFSVDEETNKTITTWNTVEGATLFDEKALWEPGYTQVVYLKVRNAGTLALKYKLSVNVAKETAGTNVEGNSFKLSDYLVFGQKDSKELITYATREDAWKAAGSTKGLNNYTKNSNLAAGAEEYIALVVYMPTTVGNEANYKAGTTAPTIELGIGLIATQAADENDSFGNDYDYIAALVQDGYEVVANVESFKAALSDGKNILIQDDITVAADLNHPYEEYGYAGFLMKGGVLDGNGKTLSITKDNLGDYKGIITLGGTIKNLSIDDGYRAILLMYPSEDLILDNVHIGGENIGYGLNTGEAAVADGVDIIATNSSFTGWNSFAGIASASFTNCQFKQGSANHNIYGYAELYDRLVKPYVNTEFKDCTFSTKYYIDLSKLGADCMITLDNCTVNGVVITAENYRTLLDAIELPTGRTLESCVIFK